MTTKSSKLAQARLVRRRKEIRRSSVTKLQRAGLLGKVDLRKRPTAKERSTVIKYKDVVTGRATAIKAPSKKQAAKLRSKFGLKGIDRVLVIPKEKGERYKLTSAGELKSVRKVYGQTVHKTIGEKFGPSFKRPENAKTYYTIPSRTRGSGGLKRRTFASFDELLFYFEKYEISFEEIEDRIEIEEFEIGTQHEKAMAEKVTRERQASIERSRRRKARAKRGKKGKRSSRGR